MDRETLLHHLEQTRRQLDNDEHNIASQKRFIHERLHDGRSTAEAKSFLRTLEDIKAMHIGRRNRLELELAELPAAGAPEEAGDSGGPETPVPAPRI